MIPTHEVCIILIIGGDVRRWSLEKNDKWMIKLVKLANNKICVDSDLIETLPRIFGIKIGRSKT